ncbi:MAG: type III polyketide synthase [Kiritimatiellia bacterium]|jgi:predicted naringenin-chalcone synthase
MSVYIQHIETLAPENVYSQDFAAERMQAWLDDDKQRRLAQRVYRNSGIATRHSVLADFGPENKDPLFKTSPDGKLTAPGTGERNDRYAREARRLAVEVSRRALAQCRGIAPKDVTHVITVTCTGFSNPGPDYYIVREAGLRPETQRYALGFMGCYAALPALRMAWQFCRADPSAVVMIVSIELCSLHLNFENGIDSLLANAIFADGAAAAIVSAREPPAGRSVYCLDNFASALIPDGVKDMAWRIGNKGFEIALSTYVPDIIGGNIRSLIEPPLAESGLRVGDIGRWAIHPGGKAILDKIQSGLELRPEQIQSSRDVLRNYGNMSSATILFVLQELMQAQPAGAADDRACAVTCGPGLTIEMAVLRLMQG